MSSPRYVALNHDTHGEVVDLTLGCQVSRHNLIRDAEAEAARLNAETVKRAAPVMAWALIRRSGCISPAHVWTSDPRHFWPVEPGQRIARVRIEEIEE